MPMDVATDNTQKRAAAPAERSPNTKAAIRYLEASGATAISVIETETGFAFRVGTKLDPRAHVVFWIKKPDAIRVALARPQIGGCEPAR
jgi:hypothetical protein